jgi:hypothetical protein
MKKLSAVFFVLPGAEPAKRLHFFDINLLNLNKNARVWRGNQKGPIPAQSMPRQTHPMAAT